MGRLRGLLRAAKNPEAGGEKRMLSRYSHVRMEAKRRAIDEIATRQRAADDKRKEGAERREQAAVISQSALLQ